MAHSITDTLNKDIIAIARQCFSGKLTTGEAARHIKRAQRLAQAKRLGVPVVDATAEMVLERIAQPPQASRPLTPEEQRRVEAGLYLEEW